MPRVSVIMPSYNHEKFVAEAIQSVLDQTYQDFEIVITDDGSSDRTVDEIRKFSDPRIRLFTFEINQGACVAGNKCLNEAKGEYVAVLSSDDFFLPDKLERQVKFLDEHKEIGAVFGYAQMIDDAGRDFADQDHPYFNIFKQPNRSRFEWLHYFFHQTNCLCHPSALIRKECYRTVGLYDERMAAMPDLEFWVRLCMKHEIYVMQENLIKFRIREGEANAAGRRPEVMKRAAQEALQIFRRYLEIESVEDFLKIFPEASRYGRDIENDEIPFILAMIALDVKGSSVHNMFGLDVLFNVLGDEKLGEKLARKYSFMYRDYIKLAGEYDPFNYYEIARCDVQLRQKESQLAAKLTELAEKDEQLAEKDEQLAEKEKEIAEKAQRLVEKDRLLVEKDGQIQDYLNSLSWRISKPLRVLTEVFHGKKTL